MKEIKLTRGRIALVDDEDFDYLNQFKWYANFNGYSWYALRTQSVKKGEASSFKERKTIWMHRIILKIEDNNIFGDHKDRNGLNNQKINLRTATKSQNNINRKSGSNSSSKFLGVSKCRQTNKWRAQIHNNKVINLGRFETEMEAALAYNIAAKRFHGEFANLNIL